MKKIILLALAALLIFTMVSCDGNADFLLWNEEEGTEKTITLVFNDTTNFCWYFAKDNNYYIESVEITVSADTWGDLLYEPLGYNLYDYDYYVLHENAEFSSYYNFMTVSADDLCDYVHYISTSNSHYDEYFVKPTDEIEDGKTYYVTTTISNAP